MTFVEGDVDHGHALLAEAAKKAISTEQFQATVARMHPARRPLTISPTEFEPVPGQKLINIFVRGENGTEVFFYRFVMQGTAESGYRVTALFRGSGPYPESKLRRTLPTASSR